MMRGLGVSLSGPHNDRHALDCEIRGVKGEDIARAQQRRAHDELGDDGCGHGHGHGHVHVHGHGHVHGGAHGGISGEGVKDGSCLNVKPAELSNQTRKDIHDRVWADEELEMDPGLAQCCIKDLEDSEKSRRYRAALASVDPVAAVERISLATRMTGVCSRVNISAKEWAARAATVLDLQQQQQQQQQQQEKEEEDSDAELDEFLNGYEPLSSPNPDASTNSNCINAKNDNNDDGSMNLCSSAGELASFLNSSGSDKSLIATIILFGSEDQPELCEKISDAICRLLQSTSVGAEEWRLRAGIVDYELIGAYNPLLASSRWLKEKRFPLTPPFCVAFGTDNLEALFAFSRVDLERGVEVIKSWWLSYAMVLSANKPKQEDNIDDDKDEGVPASSYCGRPGCPRTFPHEHVQRLNKSIEE